MRIRSFRFEPEAVAEFIDAAWALRRNDPGWVPPIKEAIGAQLSERNPFFAHGRMQNFLAQRDGQPVGRCSAMIDERLAPGGRKVGMVGFFEVEEDYATSSALLDEALGWLAAQGAQAVWGPMNFGILSEYRFKTKGFDRESFLGEPHNPPHYPQHFTRYGFELLEASASWDLDEHHIVAIRDGADAASRHKEVADAGYRYRDFDATRFDEDLHVLYELWFEAFTEHTGYVPVPFEEFAFYNGGARLYLEPELVPIIEAPDGRAAGIGYAYPDLAPVMRKLDGVLDLERFATYRRESPLDRAVFHTGMVSSRYRQRGLLQGVYARGIDEVLAKGYTRAIGALAKIGNPVFEKVYGVAERSREYALYHLEP